MVKLLEENIEETEEILNKNKIEEVSEIEENINLQDEEIQVEEEVMAQEEKKTEESPSTAIIEYREIEEPCVALTIIGENRLSTPAVFVKRGFKYSIKAFFSTLVLTIMNLFI